ncbi:MAG: hemerythrin domain-containing protein [Kiloniellales bacterium]|nr:hemerythrin domain-containing protein [Kiloniellales bacterium]
MIADPLGFILLEHREQEEICARLEKLVDDLTKPDASGEAAAIKAYLLEDLPDHETDEERVLLPLLQSRCRDDEIGLVLSRLRREHDQDRRLVETLVDDLGAICAEVPLGLPNDFAINALMLVERWRRHLFWENRSVLPLARRWLSEADLSALGHAIAGR